MFTTIDKLDDMTAPRHVSQIIMIAPLVAGYSMGHKPHLLDVGGWEMGQTKCFSNGWLVSFLLGSSNHTGVLYLPCNISFNS